MDKYRQFIRGKFTEEELESAIIGLFKEEGWDYAHGESQHRRSEECDDDSRRGHEQGKSRHFRSSCSGVSLPPHGMKKMWPDFLPLSFS